MFYVCVISIFFYLSYNYIIFLQREQLREHEDTLRQLEVELDIHKKKPPERGTKNITLQFYKEKESHLFEEVSIIFILSAFYFYLIIVYIYS